MTVVEEHAGKVIGTPAPPRGPRAAHRRGQVHERPEHPGRPLPGRAAQPVRPRPHPSVDVSGALDAAGVVAAYTGADLQDLWAAPMPCAWPVTADMKNPPHYPVAVAKACYVGDAVAVVVAPSDAAAPRRARAPSTSDYEPLAAVIGLEEALADRVVIHEDAGTNKAYTWELKVGEDAVDAAFAAAAHTVKERYVQQRLIPMAMEPRAVAAVPQPFGGDMTLYSATQIPHILKIMTALTLGIPEHQVRVVRPERGRRLRLEAQRVRRGAAVRRAGPQARRAGALERGADRERPGHHPGPGPDPGHRAGRRRERQADRRPGPAAAPTWAPTSSWSPRASRCSARSCTPGCTTSPPPTTSAARRCSPP